jgi:hypothetical protein
MSTAAKKLHWVLYTVGVFYLFIAFFIIPAGFNVFWVVMATAMIGTGFFTNHARQTVAPSPPSEFYLAAMEDLDDIDRVFGLLPPKVLLDPKTRKPTTYGQMTPTGEAYMRQLRDKQEPKFRQMTGSEVAARLDRKVDGFTADDIKAMKLEDYAKIRKHLLGQERQRDKIARDQDEIDAWFAKHPVVATYHNENSPYSVDTTVF